MRERERERERDRQTDRQRGGGGEEDIPAALFGIFRGAPEISGKKEAG